MPLIKDSVFILKGGEEHTSVSTVCTPNPPSGAPKSSGTSGGGVGTNTYCSSLAFDQANITQLLAALWGWGFTYVGPDPVVPNHYLVCVTR